MPSLDIYQIVTDRFIEALNQNVIPWQKPWNAEGEMPINRFSGKPYRGVNVMLLGITAAICGYDSTEWLTYKQATDLGGTVRKGEKSTQVVFWKVSKWSKENVATGESEDKKGFMLRYYNVFNLDQCDGIKSRLEKSIEKANRTPFQVHEAAQALWDGWNAHPPVRHAGAVACYSPTHDKITMPMRESFASPEHYYSTLYHEGVHSTGHKDRLDRVFGKSMRTDAYAAEELVAEIGSAYLCTMAGIDVTAIVDNSVAYVQHWVSKLKSDPKLIVTASGLAQKAVDMICGVTFEVAKEEDSETTEPLAMAA